MSSRRLFWLFMMLVAGVASLFLAHNGWSRPAEGVLQRGMVPLEGVFSKVADGAGNFFGALADLGKLRKENERLRQEVDRLTTLVAQMQEAKEENQKLRELLDFTAERKKDEFLVARVVSRDTSAFAQTVAINKGSNQGLREGMSVVTNGGLVGRVSQVYPTAARVLLITDPNSAVNTVVQGSRAAGIVSGRLDGSLVMEFVQQGDKVDKGNLVLTSGLGGNYPPGLLVGQVKDVAGDDLEVFKELHLQPAAKFDRIQYVLIITNFLPMKLE
ncbi:MAG: rod shape-determining protein MreC [Chloroflexi bacterium]|nr:rod shape-determining protein MreC [Chloroflexota bacterium]